MNKNLLAVGYGEFEFAKQRDGMIAFWSLKNPRYPHSIIATKSGVTALDFATASPSLLAGELFAHVLLPLMSFKLGARISLYDCMSRYYQIILLSPF